MPTIKRAVKARESKTGFESYDGPEPMKRGMYRARIARVLYRIYGTGAEGLVITGVLESQKGDPKGHAMYDGYTITTNLVFGDKAAMIAREENFYAALGVKDEPNIATESGDEKQGVKVTKIGGKDPVGVFANFDIKPGVDNRNNQPRPEVDGIYKFKEAAVKEALPVDTEEVDEDDVEEVDEDETVVPDEDEFVARQSELGAMKLPALRALARSDYDLDGKGSKDEVIAAILAYEFEDAGEAEDDEEDVEETEEDEDETEEDEDLDEDDLAEMRAELEGLSRVELKKRLLAIQPDFKVLKRHTDADLVEEIMGTETPF